MMTAVRSLLGFDAFSARNRSRPGNPSEAKPVNPTCIKPRREIGPAQRTTEGESKIEDIRQNLRWLVPLPPDLLTAAEPSTRFLARDGTALRHLLAADGTRRRDGATLNEMPEALWQAVLAAEDRRFYDHAGVDLWAVARAFRDNAHSGRVVSGASTLHQQLIKISTHPRRPRTLGTKILEVLQARHLGMTWSHDDVLSAWLNRAPFGNLLTGCTAAAAGYFDKPLSDLTPAECALLAALPQAPGRMNPFRDLDAVLPRQRRILQTMQDLGWLTPQEASIARDQPIVLQRFNGGFAAPHAVDLLRSRQEEDQAPPAILQTTIDATLQRQVEEVVRNRLAGLKERHVTQAAAVVLDNATGEVLALAGSRDFFSAEGGQINGAWAPHSPGSAIKPFTYLLALQRGMTPASIIPDLPIEFQTTTGIYRPENYDHHLYGPVTLRMALGNSLNISAVRVLEQSGGPQRLLDTLRSLGLTTLTEEADHYGLGLTIGNAPVRLLELTNAYACLARLGIFKSWTLTPRPQTTADPRLFDEAASYLIADILHDNQARLLTFGQNSVLRLPFPVAVKTGTSSSYRDNWTVGFTPEFTVGVWAGNFDNSPMQDVSGVTGAAPIFRDVMQHLHDRLGTSWYAEPAGISHARIDPRHGKRLTAQSPPARLSRDELFLAAKLPPAATAADYDAQGRALLGAEYSAWLRSRDNWLGDLVTTRTRDATPRLQITHPISGTVVRLDPDLPGGGRRLLLEARGAGEITWTCPTLQIEIDASQPIAHLVPGQHTLTARSAATGETQRTTVIVHAD
jgi:penicillin-binding protein 1C